MSTAATNSVFCVILETSELKAGSFYAKQWIINGLVLVIPKWVRFVSIPHGRQANQALTWAFLGELPSRYRRGLAASTTVGFSDQLVLSCPAPPPGPPTLLN